MLAMSIALLDIDGTWVDTNYNHSINWFRAFVRFDLVLPIWRIHTHIGMGGDQLVGLERGHQVVLATGGFSQQELRDSGAVAVYESVAELERDLESTLLA